MGDIIDFFVLGLGLVGIVYSRNILAMFHQLRVLARAMHKEFGRDAPVTVDVRRERKPENLL